MVKKLSRLLGALLVVACLIAPDYTSAAVFDTKTGETKQEISPNVVHIKSNYASGTTKEAVNILDISLVNDYTKIEVGYNNPLKKLVRTSVLANTYNKTGHYVVGAVNASYFSSGIGPVNLIAVDNEIINYGNLGTGTESPTQYPVAFGISKTGKGIIDYYTPQMSFTVDGQTYSIDLVDEERISGKTVLYSSKKTTTGTNEWGAEIVVENASENTNSIEFGDVITGTVKSTTKYGTAGNSTVPSNGFVLSINDKTIAQKLQSLPADTQISVNIGIDDKWQDAEFMLAAGPMLVNNGKVDISMATSSSFASSRQPRTAVAIDATGQRVFLVTVDGRQKGYSTGVSLKELGNYLISLGAKYAINLDGGGSTTMVARQFGTSTLSIANKPSDGSERAISTILQVVNTAPTGQAKAVIMNANSANLAVGDTFKPSVKSAYDIYLNPITLTASQFTWEVEGGIGHMDGGTFVATAPGKGKLIGTSGNAKTTIDVTVTDPYKEPIIINGFNDIGHWKTESAKATSSLKTNGTYAREGSSSLAISYDFTGSETGTKAAYAVASPSIAIPGTPSQLGIWVYGNGEKNWLRALVEDGAGTKHTIDFTEQSKLNWTGWKYVTAKMPSDVTGPFKLDRLYIVSPVSSEWSKGTIYLDKLQSIYNTDYIESLYEDVALSNWAYSAIETLNEKNLILGYPNGTYKPSQQITRAEAAVIITRYLNLKATKTTAYDDVAKEFYAYSAIQAVAEAGIITGREVGKFSPNDSLTRAEMSTIIKRTFKLTGSTSSTFPDVPSTHWAYDAIQTLLAKGYVSGYTNGTFLPNKQITRAEFASILSKAIQ